jgi:hypothetical protein
MQLVRKTAFTGAMIFLATALALLAMMYLVP